MSAPIQLTGGSFQDTEGNPLASGYLKFVLSQDASVGTAAVGSGTTIQINLDANGNVITSPVQSIWANDVLSPVGTFYTVSAYTSTGQLVWGPNAQQVLSTNPASFNLGTWVPGVVNVLTYAPPVLQQTVLLTVPVSGALEFDGTHLYFTIGTTRHTLI